MRPLVLAATLVALALPSAGLTAQKTRGKSKDKPAPTTPTQIGGKTLDEWIQDMANKDPSKAERAIRTIPHFDPERAAKALPALVALLKRHSPRSHLDTGVRANAIIAVGVLLGHSASLDRKDVQKVITLLKSLLSDTQSIVKYRAAEARGE